MTTVLPDLTAEDLAKAKKNPTSLFFEGIRTIPFDPVAAEAFKEHGRAWKRKVYAESPKLRAEAVARTTKSRKRRKDATAETDSPRLQ
jgi:hypothetical protein